jgi:hypothetical protein
VEELARGPDQWCFEEEERAAKEAAAREADRQMTPAMMMLAKQQAQDKPKEEKKVRTDRWNWAWRLSSRFQLWSEAGSVSRMIPCRRPCAHGMSCL